MKILGINISHNPSICLYENEQVLEFYNEERFTNYKGQLPESYDFKILQSIKQKVKDFDFVCYASFGRLFSDTTDLEVISKIQRQLNNPPFYFNEKEHHLYHAYTGKYFSSFDDAVCIVIDGGGACNYSKPFQEIESVYYMNQKNCIPLYKHSSNIRSLLELSGRSNWKNTLKQSNFLYKTYHGGYEQIFSSRVFGGLSFDMATLDIGFKSGYEAGKLMGLASYADCENKFDLDYDKVRIAKEVQDKHFEDTSYLIDRFSDMSKNIILSGGCALNCSNNFKFVKKYPHLNFFIDPVPWDAGTAIGVSIFYEHNKRQI